MLFRSYFIESVNGGIEAGRIEVAVLHGPRLIFENLDQRLQVVFKNSSYLPSKMICLLQHEEHDSCISELIDSCGKYKCTR